MLPLMVMLVASAPDAGQEVALPLRTEASAVDGGTLTGRSHDEALILEVIHGSSNRIHKCVPTGRRVDGKITVRFVISSSGDVALLEVVTDTTRESSLAACVAAEVLRFKFPKVKGSGSATVIYPFVFGAAADAGRQVN